MSSGHELPRGTVSFLFTDIEGSTRLVKALGERYHDVLAEHQRILRAAFEMHRGHEIDTQGDSFFVAFGRARDAINAAVAAQRALLAHDWPEGATVKVRMGIHTGEPVVGEQRYTGMGVHRAARIAAAGHGGQVLLSSATRELVEDDLPPGVALRDLGRHKLKDLDRPERIYQLAAGGLPSKFPPLKTAGATGAMRRTGRKGVVAAALVVAAAIAAAVVLVTQGGSEAASASSVEPNSLGVIDPESGSISAQVPVGLAPSGVAAGKDAVWITNTDDNSVSRIDPDTNTVRQTVPVGGGPAGVAESPDAVWVANGLDATITRIDPGTNQVVQTIPVGNGPSGIAYGEGAVWVANSADGTVSRIDPQSGRVTKTLPAIVGAGALAVGFGRVWVVSPSAATVVALDPKTGGVATSIGVGRDPSAITAGADALWVANRGSGTVSQITPAAAAVTDTITVGTAPDGIAAGGGSVWVANGADGTLSQIDARRQPAAVVKTTKLANPPQGVAVTRDGVYVAVRSTGGEHRGGTLRYTAGLPVQSIDPALAYDPAGWSTLILTNDGLVGFRRTGGVRGAEIVPNLAASLPTPTDGGRTYSFRLRPGIRYSNGSVVQARDVRATLERIMAMKPESPGRVYYGGIVGAAACKPGKPCDLSRGIPVDEATRTVTFRLREPDAEFLYKLALPFALVVPAGTAARESMRPLPATGPYRIAARTPAKSLRLVRNPVFRVWSPDAQPDGYPDVIELGFAPFFGPAGIGPRIKEVERGAADIATNLNFAPSGQLESLATRYPGRLRVSTSQSVFFFFLNTRVPPFDNLEARRAVLTAVDPVPIAGTSLARSPACQVLPPNMAGYRRRSCASDLVAARRLVRRSGTAGAKVVVWSSGTGFNLAAGHLVRVLRELGYKTTHKVVPLDPKTGVTPYFEKVGDSRTRAQAGVGGWLADYPSPASFVRPLVACSAFLPASPINANLAEFCDPRVDSMVEHATAVQAEDTPRASLLWPQVEAAILDRAPVVPVWNERSVDFVSKRLGNYQYNPQFGFLLGQGWVK